MISTTNHIRGEQLRQLRESQGITVPNLARHVHLSSAQILQLEYGDVLPGKRSMFYSSAIEEIAAIKLAKALGADPQALWNNKAIVTINSTASELQELSAQENIKSAEAVPIATTSSTSASFSPLLPAVKNGKNTFLPVVGSALVLSACAALLYSQLDISFNSLTSSALSLITLKEVPKQDSSIRSFAPSAIPATVASAPVKSPPETVKLVPALVQEPALFGCDRQKSPINLAADQPQKAGISVYIEALEEVSLCIEDSAGIQHLATLKANEHKTFRGTPPWSVHASDPAKINLFFQGQKLHWPEVKDAFFILKETAGAF